MHLFNLLVYNENRFSDFIFKLNLSNVDEYIIIIYIEC